MHPFGKKDTGDGIIKVPQGPYGPIWGPYGPIWALMGPYGPCGTLIIPSPVSLASPDQCCEPVSRESSRPAPELQHSLAERHVQAQSQPRNVPPTSQNQYSVQDHLPPLPVSASAKANVSVLDLQFCFVFRCAPSTSMPRDVWFIVPIVEGSFY